MSEVNSIIWPNPDFDNNITVYGPEVRSLAGRYLAQMIERAEGPARSRRRGGLGVGHHRADRAPPGQQDDGHQAGGDAGLTADKLYFNIETGGQHLGRQHPAGHRRRRPTACIHRADPGLRARLRRRRGRRLRRAARRPGRRRRRAAWIRPSEQRPCRTAATRADPHPTGPMSRTALPAMCETAFGADVRQREGEGSSGEPRTPAAVRERRVGGPGPRTSCCPGSSRTATSVRTCSRSAPAPGLVTDLLLGWPPG